MAASLVSLAAARLCRLFRLGGKEKAQAMIEYALIISLVVIVVLVTLIVLGKQVKNEFCNVSGDLGGI